MTQHVLLIEERPGTREYLPHPFRVTSIGGLKRALAALDQPVAHNVDVILTDLDLPDSGGLETVVKIRAAHPLLALVVLTGEKGTGLDAVRAGADDFVRKDELSKHLLQRTLRYAIERAASRAESDQLRSQLLNAERVATLGGLASGVAHEINNPAGMVAHNLTVIRRALTEGDALTPELAAMLTDCTLGVDRIRSIVRDLSSFTRHDPSAVASVDLNSILRAALSDVDCGCVEVATELGELPSLPGYPKRLRVLFVNLITNALQAMAEQSTGGLRLTTAANSEMISVIVADTGSGIAPEHIKHIFEPFWTTRAGDRGTGLGLALVADIAREHGGDVQVESDASWGTRFELRLPPKNGLVLPPPRRRPSARAGRKTKRRVLMIDDDRLVRQACVRLLQRDHAMVDVGGANEALALLEDDADFDAILCDLMMPNVDGSQFFTELRDRFPDLTSRVIFVSGGAYKPGMAEFLRATSAPLLEKPVSKRDLLEAITKVTQ